MEIFVGNLPFDCTEQDLRDVFSQYGEIASVKMLTDKFSGRFRGIAFVLMDDEEKALAAISGLNGKDFKGRPMRVDRSRQRSRFNGFGGGFARKRGDSKERHDNRRNAFRSAAADSCAESDGGNGDAAGGTRQKFRSRGDVNLPYADESISNEEGSYRKSGGYKPKGDFRHKRETSFRPKGEFKRKKFDQFRDMDESQDIDDSFGG